MASLDLSEDELRRLAQELAPLLAAALPTKDPAPAGWMDAKAAAVYAGCTIHALHKAMAATTGYAGVTSSGPSRDRIATRQMT